MIDEAKASEDEALTTRMPTIQPPPYVPFSPQQIIPSLHTREERASSWAIKPGSWWPRVRGHERKDVAWTDERLGNAISLAGAAMSLAALLGAFFELAFVGHAQRDGLAIVLVAGRLAVAFALAAFGWGVVRYGERFASR
jgi:hypothetical protein